MTHDTDLNSLLHPAQAFQHPREVVNDLDLTLGEKRSILASWASDACAVDSEPALRRRGNNVVTFDDIVDALRTLDRQAQAAVFPARQYNNVIRRERVFSRSRRGGSRDSGNPLH